MLNRLSSPVLRRWRLYGQFLRMSRRLATTQTLSKKDKDAELYSLDSSWKRDVVYKLGHELKIEHRRYAAEKRLLADQHKIVCYIRDGRVFQLLTFVGKMARTLPTSEATTYAEVFSISLKYAADFFASKMEQSEWFKSDESTLFVDSLIDALTYVSFSSNDLVLVHGFCLALLDKSRALSSTDIELEKAHAISGLKQRLNAFTKLREVRQNRLLFNERDFKTVCDYWNFKEKPFDSEIVNLGYDKNLQLADGLSDVCSSSNYKGSPFVLAETSKEKFLKQLKEQLTNEQRLCFAVKNYARNSVEKPMEKLLLEWRWDKEIASTFKKMVGKISSLTVRNYLNGLNSNDVAELLFESVIAALCQGKYLIPIQELQYSLSHSILSLSHQNFVKNSLNESADIFESVCAEYFRYFCEPELARQYNLREWWYHSTKKFNIDSNFHAPFTNFKSSTTDELSSFLIDVILNSCKIPENKLQRRNQKHAFSFRNVNLEQITDDQTNKSELVKMLELNPVLVDLIAEHQFEKLLFPFHSLPMTLPPRPWMDAGQCGPLFSRSSEVLRNLYAFPFVNVNVEMSKRLKNNVQARPVFDSLNDLGATPWIINKSMLTELIRAFDFTFKSENKELLKGLSVPMHSSTIRVPTIHEYFDCKDVSNIPSKEWFKFSKQEHALTKERNESNSLWCWLMYRIVLANHYRDEILYFPHNMDFRGRVYPISPHLNHMGDDINRCLLKFARGKPLGEKGFDWLKIHCINLTGLLKRRSIDERLAFANQNLGKIIQSANNPWAKGSWWLESEEPWQTLAACMEIRDVLESGVDPRQFMSHLPVHQDGSCNGFQHYAALGRDQQGALEVNLLPTELPADIYSNVAIRVEEKRLEDEESEVEEVRALVLDLRGHIPEAMPRKVIKQTVMTTIYGVTMFGARQQIKRQLRALEIPNEKVIKFSTYIAEKTLGSLNESFESSMKLKNWFRQCARAIVKLMQPVEWVTPLGLPVMQPYMKPEKKFDFLCHMPIHHKQIDAFPPNFVHSLDSTHMMLTTLYCRQRGVTFAAVHDCFWTHASDVEIMNEICRDQFIRLHNQPIVEDLGKNFQAVYLNKESTENMDEKTFKEFLQSLTPSTKRGSLDIEQIRKSVYFFS